EASCVQVSFWGHGTQTRRRSVRRDEGNSTAAPRQGTRAWRISPLITAGDSRPRFRYKELDGVLMVTPWRHFYVGGRVRARRSRRTSFARQPERHAVPALATAQTGLFAPDVISRHRHHTLALGELELEHHHVLLGEGHFGGGEIEFPHPHEALVVDALGLLAM